MWYCKDTSVSGEPKCGTVKTPVCQKSHYVVLKNTRVSIEPLCSTEKTQGRQESQYVIL